jgi:hypothetical protein
MNIFLISLAFLFVTVKTDTIFAQANDQQKLRESLKERQNQKAKEKKDKQKLKEEGVEADVDTPSTWFPSWATPTFDLSVRPIFAFKYTKEETEARGAEQSSTFEGGLAAWILGVGLVPSNPGLYLEPRAGQMWGVVNGMYEDGNGKEKTYSLQYQRRYGELDTALYVHMVRHVLTLGAGLRYFSPREDGDTVRTMKVKNDTGLLFKSWVSGHFTHRYLHAYKDNYDEPFLEEQDFWIHARLFADYLNFYLDIGPGMTLTKEYAGSDDNDAESEKYVKVGDGQTNYLLMLTGFNPFWKFGFAGQFKYVYESTEAELGDRATTKLPEEGLYDPPTVTMPEDSLIVSSFIGLKKLIFGLGVGYHYNLQVLNLSEKNNSKRETTRDHGFGLNFSANF